MGFFWANLWRSGLRNPAHQWCSNPHDILTLISALKWVCLPRKLSCHSWLEILCGVWKRGIFFYIAGTNLCFKQNESRKYSATGCGPWSPGRKEIKSFLTVTRLPLWSCGSDLSVLQNTWCKRATHGSGVFWPHGFIPFAVFLSYVQIPGKENLVDWLEAGTAYLLI